MSAPLGIGCPHWGWWVARRHRHDPMAHAYRHGRRRLRPVKQPNQSPPNRRFQLCAVASNFDLSVGVPGVSKATCSVKGQPRRRQPFQLERLPPSLGRAVSILGLARTGRIIDLELQCFRLVPFYLPEYSTSCRVVHDAAAWAVLGSFGGNRLRQVQIVCCLCLGREFDSCSRVVVDRRCHPGVAKVFAGFVGRENKVDVVCRLNRSCEYAPG